MTADPRNEYYIPQSGDPEKKIKINEYDILRAFDKKLYREKMQELILELVVGVGTLLLTIYTLTITPYFLVLGVLISVPLIVLSIVLLKNTVSRKNAVVHLLNTIDDSDISDKALRDYIMQCRQETEEAHIRQERKKMVGKMPPEKSDDDFDANSHYQDGYPF